MLLRQPLWHQIYENKYISKIKIKFYLVEKKKLFKHISNCKKIKLFFNSFKIAQLKFQPTEAETIKPTEHSNTDFKYKNKIKKAFFFLILILKFFNI